MDAVVEGSVLRAGDRVRITAHLIHPATDRQLWSESYERDLPDVLALQADVARAIAGEVRAKVAARDPSRPVNTAAFDLYLRGRLRLDSRNRDYNEEAIQLLERAVASDPGFASAHALLARGYVDRAFFFAAEEPRELLAKAESEVEKALSLDPNSAEAHLARGLLLWTPLRGFPHERAIQQHRRAAELNPNLAGAHTELARVYGHIGLFRESVEEAGKASAIDPSSDQPLSELGNELLWQGQYEQARAVWLRVPRQTYTNYSGANIAWALLALGRKDEATVTVDESLREYPEDSGGILSGMQALLVAASGARAAAEAKIAAAEKKAGSGHTGAHTAYFLACSYARLGRPQPAVRWLEHAAQTGFPCYPLFARDPNLDPLRMDPGFLSFLERQKNQWEN